ncbi:MAG: hypothetical protein P8M53_14395 [Pirellulales bacterium]|nr:hypothetical protein [Pirellulales bacterium]
MSVQTLFTANAADVQYIKTLAFKHFSKYVQFLTAFLARLGSSGRKVVEVRVLSPALLSSAFSGHRALAESVAINAGDSGA